MALSFIEALMRIRVREAMQVGYEEAGEWAGAQHVTAAAVFQVDGPVMRHVEVHVQPRVQTLDWAVVGPEEAARVRAADELISGAPGDAPLYMASSTRLRWTGKVWLPDE